VTEDRDLSYFVEQILSELRAWLESKGEPEGTNEEIWNANKKRLSKLAANWLINRFLKILGDRNKNTHTGNVTPENFAEFLTFFEQKKINSTTAQALLEQMIESDRSPAQIIEEKGMAQVGDESIISDAVEKAISDNPKVVDDYKSGKIQAAKFLFGLVMRNLKGKADPQAVQKVLEEKLGSLQ